MSGINGMAVQTGRMYGEDDSVINVAEKIKKIADESVKITSIDNDYEHLTVTIPANGYESSAVNIAGFTLLAFRILNNWTSANIYYEADTSGVGNNYTPVLADGQEVNEPVAVNDCISVVGNALALAPYDTIKLCSGPSTARVAQTTAVTIEVIVKR